MQNECVCPNLSEQFIEHQILFACVFCTRICYIDSMISTFCLLNKIYFTSTICTLVYHCCLIKLSKKAVVLVCKKKKLEIFVLTCIYSIKQLHYNGIVIISFLICYQVLLLTSDIFVDMFKFM